MNISNILSEHLVLHSEMKCF